MKDLITTILEDSYGKGKIQYPPGHVPAIKVHEGGSCCANCKYWNTEENICTNKYYTQWAGTGEIPYSSDEFCSDWYEPA